MTHFTGNVKDIINNYPKGIKLSTALYVEMDNKAWYWFGGSRTIYRELNPVYAMFDQYIQDIIDKNITYFDFLGISLLGIRQAVVFTQIKLF